MANEHIRPTAAQAEQFALMLACGLPAGAAIRYFLPEEAPAEVGVELARVWAGCAAVKAAQVAWQGGSWTAKTAEERIRLALDRHYAQMAYFLYTGDYAAAEGATKTKADTCRQALEAKVAGMAGKMDALNQFYKDLVAEKQAATKAAAKASGPGVH